MNAINNTGAATPQGDSLKHTPATPAWLNCQVGARASILLDMMSDMPGALGWVSPGRWEALHADWPAYPGDEMWQVALLRLGDFPPGTAFRCIDVIDQCALLVAEVGIKEPNLFNETHMHVAVRLEELIELDDRGLIDGIHFERELSVDQILRKRALGPELWESVRSGETSLYTRVNGVELPVPVPPDEEPWDDEDELWPPLRSPERMAIYDGTVLKLRPAAQHTIENIGREILEVPPSLRARITPLLAAGLFDTAVRDLGAALETRMRTATGTGPECYGTALIDRYIKAMRTSGSYLPASVKSLRQELRSIFKFIRNEFAHNLIDLEPSRGYALVSRMCWHVRDVELVTEDGGSSSL